MNDPLAVIEQACYLCLRFMLSPSRTPTGCLEIRYGNYSLIPTAQKYHPLEAVLVGEEVRSGDWKADAATTLRVGPIWIEGFLAGFAQGAETSDDQDFLQGYLTAEELRTQRSRAFRA